MKKKIPIIIAIVIVSFGFLFLILNKYETPEEKRAMTIAPKNKSIIIKSPKQTANSEISIQNISVQSPNIIGNTPQNIFLDSLCTKQDNFLYYIGNSGLNRVMVDGRTGFKQLYKSECKSINVSGKYIYFIDKTNCNICSMDLNGENVKCLKKGVFTSLAYYKDKLYFIEKDVLSSTKSANLFSMDINGNSIEKLIPGINKFTIYKDKLIYNKFDEYYIKNTLYTSDLQGKNEKTIAKLELGDVGICNDEILSCSYMDYSRDGSIVLEETNLSSGNYSRFKVNISTTNSENETVVLLSDNNNTYLLVTLYVQGSGQKSIFYKLDLNNKTLIKVLDDVNYFTSNFDDTTQEKNSVNLLDNRLFIPSSLFNQLVDINKNALDNSIPLY